MKRDSLLLLEDILTSIDLIEKYTKNLNLSKLEKKIEKQDSLIRRIEIIGEAAKNLPLDFRNKYSSVPWKDIAGMRDIIVHAYFGINLETVWKVVKNELPKFKKQIHQILEAEKRNV